LLMVSLNDAGQLFLEQQPMLVPGQLIEAVKQYRQARPNSSIVLYASKQVSYNKVVEVLDALRGVAGDRVALATLPSNTIAPTPPVLTTPPGYPYNPYQGVNPYTPYQVAPGTPQPTPGAVNPAAGSSAPPTQASPVPTANPLNQPVPAVTPTKTPVTTPSKSP
jgi:biopolymer transport protein ExbD